MWSRSGYGILHYIQGNEGFTEKSEYTVNRGQLLQGRACSGDILEIKGFRKEGGVYRSYFCPPAVSHGLKSLYTALRVWGLGLVARGVSALKDYQAIALESFRQSTACNVLVPIGRPLGLA